MDFPIDRSFVAVVPLGGRHVNHLWRLLSDIEVPYSTLLDLDWGRNGGGYGRVKIVCEQLLDVGYSPEDVFGDILRPSGPAQNLVEIAASPLEDIVGLRRWVEWLERFDIYFSDPLDLDYAMLAAYPAAYHVLDGKMRGPSGRGNPREAVLGDDGDPGFYDATTDDALRWYRYLFLGRGKPSTHIRVLSQLKPADLAGAIPQPLRRMLANVRDVLERSVVQ
jgi:hypothetical protein